MCDVPGISSASDYREKGEKLNVDTEFERQMFNFLLQQSSYTALNISFESGLQESLGEPDTTVLRND